uniref:G-protein coupled receptors family 1 profile domain-containing protein n=1 Tax=Romanomermis culicivorax TaxID=13658 RepID=A0A915HUV3_ROMCU
MQYLNPPSNSLLTFDGHFMTNKSIVYDNISRTNETPTATPNNESCPFSKHEWLTAKFYVIAVTGTSLAILGIMGNITTAMVLCRPSMRSSNNMYLTALAIFDTFLLITAILLYGMEYVYEYTDDYGLYRLWHYYVPIVYAFSHIAQTGSVYITVSVTIERFIAVVYPDRSKYKKCVFQSHYCGKAKTNEQNAI